MTGSVDAFARFCASSNAPLWALALALLLTAPSLISGLALDDFYHRYLLADLAEAERLSRSYVSLFAIANGDPTENHWLAERGYAPWWIADALKISFWRPLSRLTHELDYLLWPNAPFWMHAQNLLWYGLTVLVVSARYRSVLGLGATAGFAAFLFAIDHTHGLPVAWVANRNAIVALFFGGLSLWAFVEWRRRQAHRLAVASLLTFALALLSSEAALAVLAYVSSYLWFVDEAPRRSKVVAAAPFLAVAVGWRVAYRALGYGTRGSGLYIDPLTSPDSFMEVVGERIPLLILGQFGLPPAEAFYFSAESLRPVLWGLGLLLLLALATVLAPVLAQSRVARFWAAGAGLALLPACTTYAHNRLLTFVSIGALALLAQLGSGFGRAVRKQRRSTGRPWGLARAFVPPLMAVHLVASPLILLASCRLPAVLREVVDIAAVRSATNMEGIEQRELVILAAPDGAFFNQIRFVRAVEGKPQPRRLRALSTGTDELRVRRTGVRTLSIQFGGGLLAEPLSQLYRDPQAAPFRVGQRVELDGLNVTITSVTADGLPLRADFTFGRDLDSEAFRWITWTDTRYTEVPLPPVGETLTIPPARNPLGVHES